MEATLRRVTGRLRGNAYERPPNNSILCHRFSRTLSGVLFGHVFAVFRFGERGFAVAIYGENIQLLLLGSPIGHRHNLRKIM